MLKSTSRALLRLGKIHSYYIFNGKLKLLVHKNDRPMTKTHATNFNKYFRISIEYSLAGINKILGRNTRIFVANLFLFWRFKFVLLTINVKRCLMQPINRCKILICSKDFTGDLVWATFTVYVPTTSHVTCFCYGSCFCGQGKVWYKVFVILYAEYVTFPISWVWTLTISVGHNVLFLFIIYLSTVKRTMA